MAKIRAYGFVTLFFVLILLPLMATIAGVTLVTPVDEKRQLAKPPQWTWPIGAAAFVKDATSWFDDNFGLRSFLIRLKTQIDYSVFRTSDRVHIGADGQLFYRSVMDVEKPAVEEELRLHESEILSGVRALNEALLARGIRLIVIINLLADRFLPEKLPATVPNIPLDPRIDDFVDELKVTPNLIFVDATTILRQAQRQRPVFHKTDFHWNDPAAFVVARNIVEKIAALEQRSEPVWTHKLEITNKQFSGGIAAFMPLFFPPSENGLFVKPTWKEPDDVLWSRKEGIYEYKAHVTAPDPRLLPTVVVVGDSFFDGMERSGFSSYFRDVCRVKWRPTIKLSDVAAALPSDTRYVVVQFIEVNRQALSAFADKTDLALALKRLDERSGGQRASSEWTSREDR